jgi:hypothetical protein
MPGFVPGVHVFQTFSKQDVAGRDKPDHDGGSCQNPRIALAMMFFWISLEPP